MVPGIGDRDAGQRQGGGGEQGKDRIELGSNRKLRHFPRHP
jgi:hypothetical protein